MIPKFSNESQCHLTKFLKTNFWSENFRVRCEFNRYYVFQLSNLFQVSISLSQLCINQYPTYFRHLDLIGGNTGLVETFFEIGRLPGWKIVAMVYRKYDKKLHFPDQTIRQFVWMEVEIIPRWLKYYKKNPTKNWGLILKKNLDLIIFGWSLFLLVWNKSNLEITKRKQKKTPISFWVAV